MSEAAENLKPLLDALTADERAEVVEYIHGLDNGVEGDLTEEEWEAEVAEECERRLADLAAGRTKLVPHEEVMRRFKEKYG